MDPRAYATPRVCSAIFGLLDNDKDGRITPSDLAVLLSGSAAEREAHARAILRSARAETDGGGEPYVSWERFQALAEQLARSEAHAHGPRSHD